MRIYIYISLYTPTVRSRIVFRAWDSSVARYPAADFVVCRALRRGGCGYPSSTHAVFTLATPPRTHGRRAARPRLQSPHGRQRTAAAMRPVASETRGTRAATAQILAVLKSWQKPSSTYTASPTRRWSPACNIRGPAARSEDAPRVTPQHARISVCCSDPSGSSGGSSRQDVLSGSTGGPSAASRASCRYRHSTPVDSAPPARFTRCA